MSRQTPTRHPGTWIASDCTCDCTDCKSDVFGDHCLSSNCYPYRGCPVQSGIHFCKKLNAHDGPHTCPCGRGHHW